mmetsp:Transcript_29953/g.79864  ORF Transcript_29953/g.79864 Transcript_29953/m.79864 type:complete len:262 (+) Transcript_29953:1228-2013(+)
MTGRPLSKEQLAEIIPEMRNRLLNVHSRPSQGCIGDEVPVVGPADPFYYICKHRRVAPDWLILSRILHREAECGNAHHCHTNRTCNCTGSQSEPHIRQECCATLRHGKKPCTTGRARKSDDGCRGILGGILVGIWSSDGSRNSGGTESTHHTCLLDQTVGDFSDSFQRALNDFVHEGAPAAIQDHRYGSHQRVTKGLLGEPSGSLQLITLCSTQSIQLLSLEPLNCMMHISLQCTARVLRHHLEFLHVVLHGSYSASAAVL